VSAQQRHRHRVNRKNFIRAAQRWYRKPALDGAWEVLTEAYLQCEFDRNEKVEPEPEELEPEAEEPEAAEDEPCDEADPDEE
jgi:hypothetical protein